MSDKKAIATSLRVIDKIIGLKENNFYIFESLTVSILSNLINFVNF